METVIFASYRMKKKKIEQELQPDSITETFRNVINRCEKKASEYALLCVCSFCMTALCIVSINMHHFCLLKDTVRYCIFGSGCTYQVLPEIKHVNSGLLCLCFKIFIFVRPTLHFSQYDFLELEFLFKKNFQLNFASSRNVNLLIC